MFVEITSQYEGELTVLNQHGPSGSKISTTAPKDNGGTGALFSPTDLMATSLGCCMLTIMGIVAERNSLNIKGAKVTTRKFMNDSPRRIKRLESEIVLPASLKPEDRKKLELAAHACPVKQSLHPDIELVLNFSYQG